MINIKKVSFPMKTFTEFMTEVYDKDVVGRSQIRKAEPEGGGGRLSLPMT